MKSFLFRFTPPRYTEGKGKLSYFWCSVHMLTVPPLRCGSVSEPSSRTNPPCSRPSPLHPTPWFTTAAGAAASYLLRHRRAKTISKRLPSQLPAQILLSAMKNSPSRDPDTHQQWVFWGVREHNPCNAGTIPSVTDGDKETKNHVISADCTWKASSTLFLYTALLSSAETLLKQFHLIPSPSKGWIRAESLTLP